MEHIKVFNFLWQNTWFPKNNKASSKFLDEILNSLMIIKNQSIKPKFILTTRATLHEFLDSS